MKQPEGRIPKNRKWFFHPHHQTKCIWWWPWCKSSPPSNPLPSSQFNKWAVDSFVFSRCRYSLCGYRLRHESCVTRCVMYVFRLIVLEAAEWWRLQALFLTSSCISKYVFGVGCGLMGKDRCVSEKKNVLHSEFWNYSCVCFLKKCYLVFCKWSHRSFCLLGCYR